MNETILTSRVFSVERRQVPRPGGGTLVRDIIVHPGAVAVVPVLPDGSVVMIHNYRHSVEQELLELPAGTLGPGEPPLDCARRELEEETGYTADRLEPLCEFYTTPGITNELMHAFVATGLTRRRQRLEEGEQIRVEIVAAARLRDMLAGGRLRDAKTIAALSTYFWRERMTA